MSKITLLTLILNLSFILTTSPAIAANISGHDMHSNNHSNNKWSSSYQYVYMNMPNSYKGSHKVSVDSVLNSYTMSPVNMDMQMHMVELMHNFADDVSVMIMLPYIEKNMKMRGVMMMNRIDSSVHSQGLGDIEVSGLLSLKDTINLPTFLNLGISLPTGSINQKDNTPMGENQHLGYPMQLGSGSYAILPGLSYTDTLGKWSWDVNQISRIQLNDNSHDYRLGNSFETSAKVAYAWTPWFSNSINTKGSMWRDIKGADLRLNQMMSPENNPSLKAGERIDLFIGLTLLGQNKLTHGHRLSIEVGHPVFQRLDGPQLAAGLQGTVAWEKNW